MKTKLTKLEVNNCPNLTKLSCRNNQLIELKVDNYLQLSFLNCSRNLLTSLNFLEKMKVEELKYLDVSENNLQPCDLSFFQNLVNLSTLYIGNRTINDELINNKNYNRFHGSLKPLKNLTKLSSLDISDTDIDGGLEYLSNEITFFLCTSLKLKQSKVKSIAQELMKYHEGEDDVYNDFYLLLKIWKEKHPEKMLSFTIEKLKEKENELKIEREIHQDAMKAMDVFYRQNPPSESLALKNILEKIAVDYLTINRENNLLKQTVENQRKELETNDKLVEQNQTENQKIIDKLKQELSELQNKIEIPPKKIITLW